MKILVESDGWRLPLATALGVFSVAITSAGVARINFPTGRRVGRGKAARKLPPTIRRWQEITGQALDSILQGKRPRALPPLDWSGATSFQRKVWTALLQIPAGRTVSYGELARRIASPGAARAVGSACGANPIPVLVPCHRVVAADGRLGGFSGGLPLKRRLLRIEGVALAD